MSAVGKLFGLLGVKNPAYKSASQNISDATPTPKGAGRGARPAPKPPTRHPTPRSRSPAPCQPAASPGGTLPPVMDT